MGVRILIVEDDKELCRLLQLELEEVGYEVVAARDGLSALDLFKKTRPDLIVLDVALPFLNGMEVCRRIRQQSDAPILMMTAHAVNEEDIAQGLNLGADEYMFKPVGNIEFQARIKALLRRATPIRQYQAPTTYKDGYLSIDLNTRRI